MTIYEVDLSVHRVIQWPAPPVGMTWSAIGWITEDLFDTDPSTIEFVLQAYNTTEPPFGAAVGIYREDGAEIFFQNDASLNNGVTGMHMSFPIFDHDGITKMIVASGPDLETVTVYQLPGQLPCMTCTGSPEGSGNMNLGGTELFATDGIALFPNPASTELNVLLPQNAMGYAAIELLDATGKLVGIYQGTSGTNILPIGDLAQGTYTCHVTRQGARMYVGQFVVAR
jgi:hypothetical protein